MERSEIVDSRDPPFRVKRLKVKLLAVCQPDANSLHPRVRIEKRTLARTLDALDVRKRYIEGLGAQRPGHVQLKPKTVSREHEDAALRSLSSFTNGTGST